MAIDWLEDILYFDAEPLESLARTLSTKELTLDQLNLQLSRVNDTDLNGWVGTAKDAADYSFTHIKDDVMDAAAQVGAVRNEAIHVVEVMGGLRQEAWDLHYWGYDHGWSITSGTPVDIWPDKSDKSDDQIAEHYRVENELVLSIARIKAVASALEQESVSILDLASKGEIGDGGATNVADARRAGELFQIALDDGATDTEVAQWWRSLPEQDKQDFIALRPDLIGNLDGVPAVVRDQANRNLLPKLDADIAAALHANPGDENAKRRQQTLDAIHDQIEGKNDKQLLLVDFSGDIPKVAVASGNVDTADHVSVYVPGTGGVPWDKSNSGNDLATYVPQSESLKTTTEELLKQAGKNETVATIAWIGYDPPDTIAQASLGTDADRAAPDLASFLNGVDSSRGADDPHLTVIGHSYGSVVASEALQRGTAADDVVFTGSPGLDSSGTDWTLPDLNLRDGHVYNESAEGDWVVRSEVFGPRPDRLDGVIDLSTQAESTPIGDLSPSTGHSEYFDTRSTAQYNQAVVIAGLGHDETFVRKDD